MAGRTTFSASRRRLLAGLVIAVGLSPGSLFSTDSGLAA